MEIKALRSLDLKQQLLFVESYLPDAWEYLHDTQQVKLPRYDDNDDLITREDKRYEGILEPRTLSEQNT